MQHTSSSRLQISPFPYFDPPGPFSTRTFFLSRVVFLRALSLVYGMAFLIAKDQNQALIGDRGITPARDVLDRAEARGAETRSRREEWLQSTAAPVSVDDGTTYHTQPLLIEGDQSLVEKTKRRVLNRIPRLRSFVARVRRNERYKHWRERLWDRQDTMGRPVTTLLWLAKDRENLNPWLQGIARCGIGLSLWVFVMGSANVPCSHHVGFLLTW